MENDEPNGQRGRLDAAPPEKPASLAAASNGASGADLSADFSL